MKQPTPKQSGLTMYLELARLYPVRTQRQGHLLLYYAGRCDKEGRCHPSRETICKETKLSNSAVSEANKEFKQAGILSWEKGYKNPHMEKGVPNRYQLHADVMRRIIENQPSTTAEERSSMTDYTDTLESSTAEHIDMLESSTARIRSSTARIRSSTAGIRSSTAIHVDTKEHLEETSIEETVKEEPGGAMQKFSEQESGFEKSVEPKNNLLPSAEPVPSGPPLVPRPPQPAPLSNFVRATPAQVKEQTRAEALQRAKAEEQRLQQVAEEAVCKKYSFNKETLAHRVQNISLYTGEPNQTFILQKFDTFNKRVPLGWEPPNAERAQHGLAVQP